MTTNWQGFSSKLTNYLTAVMKPVSIALALCLLFTGRALGSTEPITVTYGANFYRQEEWEPGKLRRWMRSDGEIFLHNESGRPEAINLRFYSEAFHVPRELRIIMDGRLLAQWAIEPHAQRYIVIKSLVLEPGQHRVIFHTPQAALVPAAVGTGRDQRTLSVAFSPFSVIPASAPEAQLEWTGAFAAVPWESKIFSPQENVANVLRREGRLAEAARAYELALTKGANEFSYLMYGWTLVALERGSKGLPVLQQCVAIPGWSLQKIRVRDLCQKTADYLKDSLILRQPDRDPGHRARADGKIYEAVETYQRVVSRDPAAIHAHYWLGMLNALAERRAEARVHLNRVVIIVGDTPDGRFLRLIQAYF